MSDAPVRDRYCNYFHPCRFAGTLFCFALLGLFAPAASGEPAADHPTGDGGSAWSSDSIRLAATSAEPWNPPTPMYSRRPWERVVLLPGQILSLPLSGVGALMNRSLLSFEQHSRAFSGAPAHGVAPTRALRPGLPSLGDRTGWGLSANLRACLLRGALASRVSARYTGTTLGYNSTSLAVTGRPLALQYGYDWRPQDQFYGIGRGAARESLSGYATQREFVRGSLRWTWNRDRGLTPPGTVVTLWGGPRSQIMLAGREHGRVSYAQRFPAIGAATLDRRVENLVYGASVARDTRAGHPHWVQGERLLLTAERYDVPIHALALHDGRALGAQFTRFGFESEMGFSFMRDPRSIRLFVKGIDQQVTSGSDRLLIPDLATLGGREGLMGFGPGRFRDHDLLLARLTYLFPILRGMEVDLHSEWGSVYHDVWQDAKLGTLQSSVGFRLRVRSALKARASAGLDFSRESVRLNFALGGLE